MTSSSKPFTVSSDSPYEVRQHAADSTVKGHVIGAMAVGLVPLPLFDVAAVAAVQLAMINALARRYEVAFSRDLAQSLVAALLGGTLPVTATVTASSLFKLFPGIGHLAGGASVSILGGATTYAVGQVFIQHFEAGGTLLNFDARRMRRLFRRELETGKSVADSLRADSTHPA